jgi:6-phosphogluconolactonase (cycloisomerase 2 family)
VFALNAFGIVVSDTSGSPLSLSAHPTAIALNSTGTLAVVTTDANTVFAVPLDRTSGALGTPGAAVPTGNKPVSIAVDALDKFVYVANQTSGNVSAFALGTTGSLTPLVGSPYAVGTDAMALRTTHFSLP